MLFFRGKVRAFKVECCHRANDSRPGDVMITRDVVSSTVVNPFLCNARKSRGEQKKKRRKTVGKLL